MVGMMKRNRRPSPSLIRLSLPGDLADKPVPGRWESWITKFRRDIEAFQDRWDTPSIEQYVAADFVHVGNVIDHVGRDVRRPDEIQNRFLEWGCGFGLITLLAADLGMDAVGIESESRLLEQAAATRLKLVDAPEFTGQLTRGNFLPRGSESLADDPTHPSLGHVEIDAYRETGLDIDDFGIIYSYPWPGENEFHRRVFQKYAAPGAVHIQFVGPNDVQAWQKHHAADR